MSLKGPLLLLLETATGFCSVALAEGEQLLSIRTGTEEREHAAKLMLFIQEVMVNAGKKLSEINAVIVSKGPGSYTGLRIGIAAAKGICYTLKKPLIAVDTTRAMATQYAEENKSSLPANAVLVPVIDARRMEVYGASFSASLEELEKIRAEILNQDSFVLDKSKPHYVFGDAALKCVEVYKGESNVNVDTSFNLSALGLLKPALKAYSRKQFEELASFEPYYLKEFVVKVKQKQDTL